MASCKISKKKFLLPSLTSHLTSPSKIARSACSIGMTAWQKVVGNKIGL